ncbi:hypothetical protein SAMN02745121_08823 [Nannocystis exedens]|uniref:Uncharacterized protein n=1 Tax=Nannocystis exedens TaxID=54 RepID=A0A1I2INB1_9BACT|nr:hypothetical protein [Nannocystis exedens]PCC74962.1 hypothetical protein NAEX_08062 [Nannocystis exedens]SFF43098.1 hypothetical protein SAMN02745121_08823 [Nannocystis exedens]
MSMPPESRSSAPPSGRARFAASWTAAWLSLAPVALSGCTGGAPAAKTGEKEAAPKQPPPPQTPENQPYAPPPPDVKLQPDPTAKPEPRPEPQPKTPDPQPEPRPHLPPPT